MADPAREYQRLAVFARDHYLACASRARARQAALLAKILAGNQATAFGKAHRFEEVHSVEDYQQRVPVRTYGELEPWIARAIAGEPALTSEPPLLLHRTSTTTGAAKRLPITRRGIATMFANSPARYGALLEAHPELCDAPDATLSLTINPPVRLLESDGVPSCFFSQTDWERLGFQRHPGGPGAGAPWLNVPAAVIDPYYYRVRVALESRLRGILTWFPASLLHLANTIAASGELLVKEIHDGTVEGRAMREPNRARAAALTAVLSASSPLTLRDVWPELRVVECWRTSTSRSYLDKVRACTGNDVEIFPAGYGSTETPVAFTVDRGDGSLLDVTCAFFEFAPVGGSTSQPVLSHQVEPGQDYELVVTTMNGLYRYALGDVVHVHDIVNTIPRLEFRYRTGVACSLTGEKLTEPQVAEALRAVVEGFSLTAEASLSPCIDSPPHYVLLIEADESMPSAGAAAMAEVLDRTLSRNVNYTYDRARGTIGSPRVEVLTRGTFAEARRRDCELAESASPQQKHRLVTDAGRRGVLQRLSTQLLARQCPVNPSSAPGEPGDQLRSGQ